MRKFNRIILLVVMMFLNVLLVNAETKEVTLNKCVDGDTAWFNIDNETVKTRFLAIDTPETVHPTKEVEKYGKNASEYTCNSLTNAKKIVLEYDDNSDKKDKYDRDLVWVFVDDVLLQKELVEIGYAEVKYIYGDYKYTNDLYEAQDKAKKENLGIWADEKVASQEENIKETTKETDSTKKENNEKNTPYILIFIVTIILYILKKKLTKKKRKYKKLLKR